MFQRITTINYRDRPDLILIISNYTLIRITIYKVILRYEWAPAPLPATFRHAHKRACTYTHLHAQHSIYTQPYVLDHVSAVLCAQYTHSQPFNPNTKPIKMVWPVNVKGVKVDAQTTDHRMYPKRQKVHNHHLSNIGSKLIETLKLKNETMAILNDQIGTQKITPEVHWSISQTIYSKPFVYGFRVSLCVCQLQ